jgi:RNA polymerase sigma factor (sigma-70 family)
MASAGLGTAFRHLRDLFAAGSVVGMGDGPLLARYSSSKDEAAFEALVSRHGPMVLATCRAVLRNEQDVEDAFQATFLVLARKAHSIKGADALGGWLHRVAYRASVQASVEAKRRRQREAEASAMAPLDTSRPGFETELKPILHEEIDRLSETHRLPVVLCDLEGLTYEQAAEQLRWTVPTVRCRLAKARQRLKARLTRRGVTSLAVGVSLVPKGASASVPAALIRSTVLAATTGSASGGAALLAHTLLKGMLMTKIKIASTTALAALALASAGLIAFGSGKTEDPRPTMKPKNEARANVVARDEPAGKKPMEMVEIKGRVVAADGKAVAGATVRGVYLLRDAVPWPWATSGPDGRFTILMPEAGRGDRDGFSGVYPWLVAVAPGHGVGWTQRALRADRPEVQEVRLVEEGPPIEGRIIDLEGRPIAGARVEAAQIWFDENGDLSAWIARARNGAVGNLWQTLTSLSLDPVALPAFYSPMVRLAPIATSTGPDGRFKLTGVGRDRVAELIISGPGVATTQLYALSRPEAEIRTVDRGMMKPEPFIVHAPKFEVALAPSKRVEGTVRDKDTGRPIAGIEIHAAVSDDGKSWNAGIDAWTDAEGRYRIDGLPKADAYQMFTKAERGLPYPNGSFEVPADSPGLGPVAFDFTLKRGILVRGRVTDKVTGRPIRGYANYHAFADNPHRRDYPGFSRGYAQFAYFDEDGRYELIALPGRGLIAVRDEGDRYLPDSAMKNIKGYDEKMGGFRVVPGNVSRSNAIVAEINVTPNSEGVTLDLQADPGKSVPVEVVGPDGSPLGGTKVKGSKEMFQTAMMPQESSGFEVRALQPGKPRRVVVMHEGLKLIGSTFLKGDESGPVTIKLQPWGSLTGRIVDDEGKPRKGIFLSIPWQGPKTEHPETRDILPGSDWHNGVRVEDDGRFRVEGLVPGLRYDTTARSNADSLGDLFQDVTVAPGEVKDLGDIKVQPPNKQED